MTKVEADEILEYVAKYILSPMAFDDRKASEVWEEIIGEPFSNLCKKIFEKVEKPLDKSPKL